MRLLKWLFGILLAVSLVVAGMLLLFFLQSSPPSETSVEAAPAGNMTAKNAYTAAIAVAHDWTKDATLLGARATFEPGGDFQSGAADWTLVFYSPEADATALVSVVNGRATLINVRPTDQPLEPLDVDRWQIDSPDVVSQMLAQGGDEFLRSQPGANLVLALNMENRGSWQGMLIHKESRRAFAVQLDANAGKIVAVHQSG